ncbi:MFS transporter [Alkalihalophilus pseudofirmus]|uniref:MFS transporter n=1 Tax=Alkalihalophilus pseudofirmus TaxID=79885 RepID=A0AAJ2U1J3_ALKPS|nr:MFS transporter [Alkalihalophilus pseudofirmus]MDV2885481.1 MFS transporter [Alkalihalophilus pseudofirmus]
MLASLGFGRFSLGAILPFMKDGIDLDYRQIGFVASAAFIGYLISVAVVGYFVVKIGAKVVINVSLTIIIVGMLINANAANFFVAVVGVLLLGVGSGGSSIPAMGLAGSWFSNKNKGMAIGIAMGGLGVGMVISGILVPQIVRESAEGWRDSWYILAGITSIFILINGLFLKNAPALKHQVHPAINNDRSLNMNSTPSIYRNKRVWTIGFIYLSWGFSYLVFSTFLVDYLMFDLGYSKERSGLYFSIAGALSIASGFIWGTISDKLGRMYALSAVLLIQFTMLIALSISISPLLVAIEVGIYGLTLWAVPTIMNAAVADFVSPKAVPIAMGFVTIFFSVGQIISPLATGVIIEMTNKYFGALILSAFVSLIGGIACMKMHQFQRKKDVYSFKQEKAHL